ncbi:MAG: ribonuclease III [Flavobacteriaceae bacterium]|nr:ribonuclease III [Flavobacteriaceae bacterium]
MNFLKKFKRSHSKEDEDFLISLKRILGYKPKNIFYYKKAFTHSSVKEIKVGKPYNYERLEFLGDSFLDAIVASFLYKNAPLKDEGYLTQMRSKIVSRESLNRIGRDLELTEFVKSTVAKENFGNNIYGNIFEALIGAVYLDKGYEGCHKFITKTVIKPYVNIKQLEGKITSYKSVLIEWCQKYKKTINFDAYEDNANEKRNHFSVKLSIDNKIISKGRATSKKKAEEIASKRAYYTLQHKIENKSKMLINPKVQI